MSRILARLVLAASAILAAPVLLILTFIVLESTIIHRDAEALAVACLLAASFFVATWVLVWRAEIDWTPRRKALTVFSLGWSLALAALTSVLVISSMSYHDWARAVMIGTMVWWVVWMPSTALVWRETSGERTIRLGRGATPNLPCPECGYNLTGLREARCPECGAAFTLDQLVGAITCRDSDLPGRDAV